MRATRAAALVLAIGCAIVAAPVAAAPCSPVVRDARGDTAPGLLPSSSNDTVDILAVDFHAARSTLDLTVQLAAVSDDRVPARVYDVYFTAGRREYDAYAYIGVEGPLFGFNGPDGEVAIAGAFDPATRRLKLRVPLAEIAAPARSALTEIYATSAEYVGTNGIAEGDIRDEARSSRAYRLGTRGCL